MYLPASVSDQNIGLVLHWLKFIDILFLSCRLVTLHFSLQVYLPSAMFVVVSWVSFLVKPEVVPGRMAMLVTLFLVLINIFNSVRLVLHYP